MHRWIKLPSRQRKDEVSSGQSEGLFIYFIYFFLHSQQNTIIDSDKAAAEFSMCFAGHAFSVDEPLVFKYDKKFFSLRVKEIEGNFWGKGGGVASYKFYLYIIIIIQNIFVHIMLCRFSIKSSNYTVGKKKEIFVG